jgi:hypothetical protein
MRTRKPEKKRKPAPRRESVVFDRSPSKEKFQLDLDCAIATASEHGLNGADIVEQLFRHAEREAILARERNEDLSHLSAVLFGEDQAEEDGVIQ